MTQDNKNDTHQKLYTRLGKLYSVVLLGFVSISGISIALRAISASILSSVDLFSILLEGASLAALIGIFMEKMWARFLAISLYACVFFYELSGLSGFYRRSMIESVTLIAMPTVIRLFEVAILLALGIILILQRPSAEQ